MGNTIEQMFKQEGHRLKAVLEQMNEIGGFGGQVFEATDEYGWSLICDTWDAEAAFADACEYGDAEEPGQLANVTVFCSRVGGQILPGFAPYNYTDRVWCDLATKDGRTEFLYRLSQLEEFAADFAADLAAAIREQLDEDEGGGQS